MMVKETRKLHLLKNDMKCAFFGNSRPTHEIIEAVPG